MRILVWKRKKEAGEPWGTFFRGGRPEPISRRKFEPLKTSFNRGTRLKQEWSKIEARLKQDSSKTQARLKQDSSKAQARLKQDSSKTASRGTKTLKNHYVFHQTCLKRATFEENPCVKTQKTKKQSSKTIMIYVKNCQTGSCLMRILVWKRKKEAEEPWGTFFRGGPPEPISRRK